MGWRTDGRGHAGRRGGRRRRAGARGEHHIGRLRPGQGLGAALGRDFAQGDGAVQQVFQLAHIAFQRLRGDVAHELGRQRQRRAACVAGDARQQRLAQRGQVFAPLAQGRHDEFDDVQAVIQVLPEVARLHLRGQILVRGADDAHVHRLFLRGAQRPHAPLLYGAQQLGLHGQGQIANFVQKQRAACGRLEKALPVLRGAGVGTLARAEKLGFEQVFRNRAAVDRHKGAAGAMAARMHRAGHQFLARARFAVHQHGGHAAGHLGNALLGRHQGGRLAHQPRQRGPTLGADVFVAFGQRDGGGICGICRTGGAGCSGRSRGRGRRGLGRRGGLGGAVLQGGGNNGAELLEFHRLGEVVESAGLERLHGGFGRAVGRDHDAALGPAGGADFAQQLHAQPVGQAHVGDQHIEGVGGQGAARFGQIGGALHLVAFADEGQFVESEQVGFVIDDEDLGGGHDRSRAGSDAAGGVAAAGGLASAAAQLRVRKKSLPSTSSSLRTRMTRS